MRPQQKRWRNPLAQEGQGLPQSRQQARLVKMGANQPDKIDGYERLGQYVTHPRDRGGNAFGRSCRKHDQRRSHAELHGKFSDGPSIVAVGQVHVENENIGPDALKFQECRSGCVATGDVSRAGIFERRHDRKRDQAIIFDNKRAWPGQAVGGQGARADSAGDGIPLSTVHRSPAGALVTPPRSAGARDGERTHLRPVPSVRRALRALSRRSGIPC